MRNSKFSIFIFIIEFQEIIDKKEQFLDQARSSE